MGSIFKDTSYEQKEFLAKQIRADVRKLNNWLQEAAGAGVVVEVNLIDSFRGDKKEGFPPIIHNIVQLTEIKIKEIRIVL